jgi:hypothetical protein
VLWCALAWFGLVWFGVVWCGLVWFGVVWCSLERYRKKSLIPSIKVVDDSDESSTKNFVVDDSSESSKTPRSRQGISYVTFIL